MSLHTVEAAAQAHTEAYEALKREIQAPPLVKLCTRNNSTLLNPKKPHPRGIHHTRARRPD